MTSETANRTTDSGVSRAGRSNLEQSDTRPAWLFLAPGLVLLLIFIVVPFGLAVWFSFTNQRLISPLPTRFVGLDNYVEQLTDPLFWKSMWNNLRFAVFVVPFQTAFALFLAVLVNQKIRGRTSMKRCR